MPAANTTTLFDLNQTAGAAAVSALGKDALGAESIKLEAFTAAGHDRLDFAQWEQYFGNHLANYTSLKRTPSPAAKAAAAAPAVTAAPAGANTISASVATNK